MRLRRLDNPYFLLVLTVLFWSGNFVVGRGSRGEVPPVALAFWRWSIAFACVLPFAWPHRASMLRALRTDWPILCALALLGVSGYNTLVYIGLQFTTATNGVLLNSFIPIVIIGISWAFLGKRLSLVQALGAAVSFCGVCVIVSQGQFARLAALSFNPGDLWIMVSVFIWASYTVLLQYRPKNLHPMALLGLLTGLGLIALSPIYAWEISTGRQIHLSVPALASTVYTGVFPAFLGYVLWNRAVAQVGGSVAGMFIHLMPVATPLLSALFLGETLQVHHFAGMAFIISGIMLTARR